MEAFRFCVISPQTDCSRRLVSLILASCESPVSIRTDDSSWGLTVRALVQAPPPRRFFVACIVALSTGGFSTGVSFKEWLYRLEIEAGLFRYCSAQRSI